MSSKEKVDIVDQEIGHGVGALLKASRLRVGDDLRDISEVLRIRFVYLEAIEDGRFGDLPGPTYATGFIRAYAEQLGLDSEEVVRRYKADVSGDDGMTDNSLVFPEPIPEPGIPGGAVVFVGIVVAVVAYGVWYVNTSKEGFLAELISPVPERLAVAAAGDKGAKGSAETAPQPSPPAEPEAAEKSAEEAAEKPADTDQAMTGDAPAGAATAGSAPEESQAESQETPADESKQEMAPMTPAPESTPETAVEPAPETVAEPVPETTPETAADKPADTSAEKLPDNSPEPVVAATPEPAPPATAASARKPNPLLGRQVATVPEDQAAPATSAAGGQRESEQTAQQPEPQPAAQPEPQPQPETPSRDIVSTSTPAPPSVPSPETASLLSATSDGGGKVTIRALTNSWIQIRDDIAGELLVTRLLRVGDSYAVPNRKGLKLSTGNAGALEILVDGITVPAIGADGEVRRNVALEADKLKAGTAGSQ